MTWFGSPLSRSSRGKRRLFFRIFCFGTLREKADMTESVAIWNSCTLGGLTFFAFLSLKISDERLKKREQSEKRKKRGGGEGLFFAKFCFQILECKDALESTISIVNTITHPTKILQSVEKKRGVFFKAKTWLFPNLSKWGEKLPPNQKRGSGFPNQGSVNYIHDKVPILVGIKLGNLQ